MYRGSWFRYYVLCLRLCKVKTEHFFYRTSTMCCNGAQCWVKWRTSPRIWQRCPVNTGSINNHLETVYYWRELLLILTSLRDVLKEFGKILEKVPGSPKSMILFRTPALGGKALGPERFWTSCFISCSPNANPFINSHNDVTSPFILNENAICFIAFLDVSSTKNGYQKHKKFRTLAPPA